MIGIKKPVRRKSEAVVRDAGKYRQLIVTIYPNDVVGLRPQGTRREELVTLEAVYSLGVKQRVAKERSEKIAAKKAKQK